MVKVLKIVVMIVEWGAAVLIVLESVVIVVEVVVPVKSAVLQRSLPQKQVWASFRASPPMSKVIPASYHVSLTKDGWRSVWEPGATPDTHPELWDWGAPQLHPPTVTPSTSEKETCFKLLIIYDFLAKIESSPHPHHLLLYYISCNHSNRTVR